MSTFARRRADRVLAERPGLIRVELDDGSRAYALTQLTGPVAVGDHVVVNTTAIELGLGTGGWHVVHWNLDREPFREPGPGHLMKLRYTSLQVDTGAAEELDEDPDADEADVPVGGGPDLDGIPVVVAGLHSQLPILTATIASRRPGIRIAYVMTDGGALPLALSDMVAALRDRDLLVGTVTAGHAFGGDLEALNVPSALISARHRLGADVVIAAMGPGVAGTASRLGFSGLEAASVLDAVDWLRGSPVFCLRASGADPRIRHRGISHHSRTVLDAVRSTVEVAIPPELEPTDDRHAWCRRDPGDVAGALADLELSVRSMGRGIDEDPLFFRTTAAAGVRASEHVEDEA